MQLISPTLRVLKFLVLSLVIKTRRVNDMGVHNSELIRAISNTVHDHEYYPTTNEILTCIKNHMSTTRLSTNCSVLDVGAGSGSALNALTKGKRYAIEKSIPLLGSLDKEIFVVGTDFHEQQLIDKKVDAIFSNPPYSEFERWATRIITEGNAHYVYLVIPTRWNKSDAIEGAIEARNARAEVIGSFDFLDAERKARALVDVVCVKLCGSGYYSSHVSVDPFKLWFVSNFDLFQDTKNTTSAGGAPKTSAEDLKERLSNALVPGVDLVAALQEMYDHELTSMMATYKKLESIETYLLQELGANITQLQEALSLKIKSVKDKYWRELFSNLDKVTDRLTSHSREKLLGTLFEHTHVDFTKANSYSLVQWMCKNANQYFDDQLVKLVENMIDKSNVVLYKSNKKTFGDERWRYLHSSGELNHFCLDYRIIVTGQGGRSGGYGHVNGLSKRSESFLNDLCTVAGNLGFDTSGCERAGDFEWFDGGGKVFTYYNHTKAKHIPLFTVRAYFNGNLHIKLNVNFIQKLNVQFGKLKGWIKTPADAVNEMDVDIKVAEASFNANFKIGSVSDVLAITRQS